jgi:hypothetical protein
MKINAPYICLIPASMALISTTLAREGSSVLALEPYLECGYSDFDVKGHPGSANIVVAPRSGTSESYSLGAVAWVGEFIGLDAGFIDFGRFHTGSEQVYTLPEYVPYTGADFRVRGSYLLPTLRYSLLKNLGIRASFGPMLATQEKVPVSSLIRNRRIRPNTQESRELVWLGKCSVYWNISDHWQLYVAALYSEHHFSNYWEFFADSADIRLTTFHVGISYHGDFQLDAAAEAPWRVSVGPVFSKTRYHANFDGTSIGGEITIARRVFYGAFLGVGHTDFGVASDTPTYPDGSRLKTPLSGTPTDNGKLNISTATTYAMAGYEWNVGRTFSMSIAAGAGRTRCVVMGDRPAGNLVADLFYVDSDTQATWLARARLGWRPTSSLTFSVDLGYTELGGPQITDRRYETDFGNTQIRIWSLMPAIGLSF